MQIKNVIQRVGRGEFRYIFGRFRIVRLGYSRWQRMRRFGRLAAPSASDQGPTLFPGVNVRAAVETIEREAVFVGLRLPPAITSEIEEFARTQPIHSRNDPEGSTFFYDDVERGYTKGGLPVPLAGVSEPTRCEAVRRVVRDPVLRSIVREYLGYEPKSVLTLLSWSFASDFSDEERRRLKHHVIDYHYDVGGFNFAYASFYILDTDRNSGAHAMIKRSHKRKPLRMLLGSAVAAAEDVRREFGAENEITIEGPAGTGFVQDTSCFHRATPPTQRDRLMLAVRFS